MTAVLAPAPPLTFRPRLVTTDEAERPAPTFPPETLAPVIPVDFVGRSRKLSAATYRRRRLTVVAVAVGVLFGIVSFVQGADARGVPAPASPASGETVTVFVQSGDTLWGIASRLDPGHDPRPLVDALAEQVGSSSLQPGQQLIVPTSWLD